MRSRKLSQIYYLSQNSKNQISFAKSEQKYRFEKSGLEHALVERAVLRIIESRGHIMQLLSGGWGVEATFIKYCVTQKSRDWFWRSRFTRLQWSTASSEEMLVNYGIVNNVCCCGVREITKPVTAHFNKSWHFKLAAVNYYLLLRPTKHFRVLAIGRA